MNLIKIYNYFHHIDRSLFIFKNAKTFRNINKIIELYLNKYKVIKIFFSINNYYF